MRTVPNSEINKFQNPSKLPKLGKGEKAVFRLLGIKPDPVNKGKLLCPTKKVAGRDYVIDPTVKDGDVVEIANIRAVRPNGHVDIASTWFESDSGGMITLNGDKPRDRDRYTFLMLSNANASNPNADGSKRPIFELVDESLKAESRSKQRMQRKAALSVAEEMSVPELKEFVASINQNPEQPEAILRDIVETMAEKSPQDFMNAAEADDRQIRAIVKQALTANLIKFDKRTRAFTYVSTGDVLCKVDKGVQMLDGYVQWAKGNPNGEKVHVELVKRLKNHSSGGSENTTEASEEDAE